MGTNPGVRKAHYQTGANDGGSGTAWFRKKSLAPTPSGPRLDPRACSESLPLLDSSVLDRLRAELDDDEGVWSVFVQDFVAHLPARTEKLRLALTTADLVGARNAVLSLKTSSQMVGAENLAGLALDLEHSLRAAARNDDPEVALPRLAADYLIRIGQSADQTAYLLNRLLHQRRGGA